MMNATKDESYGHDSDAVAAAESGTTSDKPWAAIVLACFAVNLVTLIGIAVTALTRYCVAKKKHKLLIETLIVPSFAAGALLATAVFLLLPESIELLIAASSHSDHEDEESGHNHRLMEEGDHAAAKNEELHDDEGAFAWKFGVALLSGFLLPLLLHTLLPRAQTVMDECEACQQEEDFVLSPAARVLVEDEGIEGENPASKMDADKTEDMRTMESGCDAHDCAKDCPLAACAGDEAVQDKLAETPSLPKHTPINLPLTLSILLGDAIHNITDGVFLSNAFLLCSRDIAWTMVATTIYHELAQELADYIVLTTHCGLPVWKALLFNFLSGFSVLLGALIILMADLSSSSTGVILAVGSGVYVYIAAVECVPRVLQFTKGQRNLLFVFLGMFFLGAVPIGLVLINHGHCGSEH